MQIPSLRPRLLTRVAAPTFLLAVGSLVPTALAQETAFELASVIPGDVFLMTETRYNPEREFLDAYWSDVWEVFQESGVIDDVVNLALSAAGEEMAGELTRIHERFLGLCTAVDWDGLMGGQMGGQMAFAERLPVPTFLDGGAGIVMQPEMVAIFRTDAESAAAQYASLRSILDAVLEEINQAAEMELQLDETERGGLTSVVFSLTQIDPSAPPFTLTLGHRGDLLAMTFGTTIGDEVADLLTGTSEIPSVADNQQYRNALASLPPAKDGYSFVDIQVLRASIDKFMDALFGKLGEVEGGELSETLNAGRAVADRLIGILDTLAYSATVLSTDGYSVHSQSITVLREGAKENPFYPVLIGSKPVANFAQYLPQGRLVHRDRQRGSGGSLHLHRRHRARSRRNRRAGHRHVERAAGRERLQRAR